MRFDAFAMFSLAARIRNADPSNTVVSKKFKVQDSPVLFFPKKFKHEIPILFLNDFRL